MLYNITFLIYITFFTRNFSLLFINDKTKYILIGDFSIFRYLGTRKALKLVQLSKFVVV